MVIAMEFTIGWPSLLGPGLTNFLRLGEISDDQSSGPAHDCEGGVLDGAIEVCCPCRAAESLLHEKRKRKMAERGLALLDLALDIRTAILGRRICSLEIRRILVLRVLRRKCALHVKVRLQFSSNGGIAQVGDDGEWLLLLGAIEIAFELPDHVRSGLDAGGTRRAGAEKPHDLSLPHLEHAEKGWQIENLL